MLNNDALSLIHCELIEMMPGWTYTMSCSALAKRWTSKCTWISERDGWRHIYLADRSGKDVQAVGSGYRGSDYDVIQLLHVNRT